MNLVVRKLIAAPAERLFDLWTRPEHIRRWWGPESVVCNGAEVDLRVGGHYRIGNLLPDGTTVWIGGTFEAIDRPHSLTYSWRIEPHEAAERVTVRFEPRGDATEVVVEHERIADQAARTAHERGWIGCLDGLAAYSTI